MNTKTYLWMIVSIFLIIMVPFVASTTYYVDSVRGVDTNNGLSAGTAFNSFTKFLTMLSSGDTGYVLNGVYVDTAGFNFQNKVLSKGIVITAYPGAKPTITARMPEFYNVPNTRWSSLGKGLWVASYSSTIATSDWMARYSNSNMSLFTYRSLSDLSNSLNPEGIFFDNTNDKLYLRLNNINLNPNSISLSISNAIVLTTYNIKGSELKISGLTFDAGYKGIYITTCSNITLDNNIVKGGFNGIGVKNSRNILLNNNKIFMIQGTGWTWSDDVKGSLMETSAIFLDNDYEGLKISNNNIQGYFNGILVYSTSTGKFRDIRVNNNYIHDIMDDGLEIERYCNGGEFYGNNISDAFVTISLSPVDASEKKCLIHHNVLVANKSVRWNNAGTYYTGECYKLPDSAAIRNLDITHNTCVGRGIYSAYSNSQYNINWIDNIFYSNLVSNGRNIGKSGLASNGVYYNNNLYYRINNLGIFQYWNNDKDATEYITLSSAKASSNWNSKWDTKSVQANPLLSMNTFKPATNSPACNMSSTGSYVGAIPCDVVKPNTAPTQGIPNLRTSDYPLNTTASTLFCYNISTYDADKDIVTNSYKWFRNGVRYGVTSSTLNAANTTTGDVWMCEVTPYDGKVYGVAKNSSSILIRGSTISGLQGSWDLSTNYIDSIKGNSAIPKGNVVRVNGSTLFNNTNSYLVIDYNSGSLTPKDGFTVDAKVKFNSVKQNHIVRDKTSYVLQRVYINSTTSRFQAGVYSSEYWVPILNSTTDLILNRWYRVTYTYDAKSSVFKLYIDKNLDVQRIWQDDVDISSSSQIFIGNREQLDRWLNGNIRDVRIYNRSLTDTEIKNMP